MMLQQKGHISTEKGIAKLLASDYKVIPPDQAAITITLQMNPSNP
jgi:hypothetical protein